MTPWLNLENFCVFIEGQPFVQNIHVSLSGNSSLAIFGPTGSGKSLLLKGLMGLQPVCGGLNILNTPPTLQQNKGALPNLSPLYDQIGFAFQQNGLFDFCTVEENLTLGHMLRSSSDTSAPSSHAQQQPEKTTHEYAQDILKHLGLWEHRHKQPSQLSGGQKKRLSIARALTKRPRILITDDPLAGLDPVSSNIVLDLLVDAVQTFKVGLIASISSSAITQNRFTHCLVLHQGKQLFFDTSEQFQEHWPELSKQF